MYITLHSIQLCTVCLATIWKIHAIRIHISRSFICRISFPSVLFLGFSQTTPCVDHIDHCFRNAGSTRAAFSGLCHDEDSLRSLFKIIKIYRSVMIWSILVWYGQIFQISSLLRHHLTFSEKNLKCKPCANSEWQLSSFRIILLCHQSKTGNSNRCRKLLWHLWPNPLAQIEHVRDTEWYLKEVFWVEPCHQKSSQYIPRWTQ